MPKLGGGGGGGGVGGGVGLADPPLGFWGGKEGKREVFTSFSHPTRRRGRRT